MDLRTTFKFLGVKRCMPDSQSIVRYSLTPPYMGGELNIILR